MIQYVVMLLSSKQHSPPYCETRFNRVRVAARPCVYPPCAPVSCLTHLSDLTSHTLTVPSKDDVARRSGS